MGTKTSTTTTLHSRRPTTESIPHVTWERNMLRHRRPGNVTSCDHQHRENIGDTRGTVRPAVFPLPTLMSETALTSAIARTVCVGDMLDATVLAKKLGEAYGTANYWEDDDDDDDDVERYWEEDDGDYWENLTVRHRFGDIRSGASPCPKTSRTHG